MDNTVLPANYTMPAFIPLQPQNITALFLLRLLFFLKLFFSFWAVIGAIYTLLSCSG